MKQKICAVGNTHFDPVWLWTLDEAMVSIRSTFRSALDRMKEYPEFIYSFSCPPVFEWIRETDPELFEEIREAVRNGRWDLCEGWYLQADSNAPRGESLVRQALYGQQYLRETFGKLADSAFNSDSFGHSAMMPQILKKCGIEHYVFTRPEEDEKDLPAQLFRWKSKDGSEVDAFRIVSGHKPNVKESLAELNGRLAAGSGELMLVYGVTNHGGAPTKRCIEELRAQENVIFTGVSEYFRRNAAAEKPVVEGELQVRHFGVFVNDPRVKRWNRQAETALLNAEKTSALFAPYGKKTEWKKLRNAWKDVLFNQFHDIIGGACIQNAYHNVRDTFGRALADSYETLHRNLQFISKRIAAEGEYWNVVLFNLNDTDFDGYAEAEIQWAWEFEFYKGGIELIDPNGESVPTQIIRELSVVDGFRSRFVFPAHVPAMGYSTYRVKKCEDTNRIPFDEKQTPFGNAAYTFAVDRQTGEVSVTDNRRGRVYERFLSPCVLEDEGDTWAFNINGYGKQCGQFALESVQCTEFGPFKKQLKLVSRFCGSTLTRYFTLYGEGDAIDCTYKVNWCEQHKALKFYMPKGAEKRVVSGVPYGWTERNADGREYPMSDFIAAENFALVCDGIFACDATKDRIGLTVLRSPVAGDLRLSELDGSADYDYISNGITEGKIRFLPSGDLKNVMRERAELLNPLISVDETVHGGDLAASGQFFTLKAESVALEVIKKAEDSDAVLVRLYEYGGIAQRAALGGVFGAYEADFAPFEIKTLLLENGRATECDCLERPYTDK